MNEDIFECCRKGDLVSVKKLIEEHKVVYGGSEIRNEIGNTPLHLASYKGHLEIVKYLVEDVGVETETKSRYGQTPLHEASCVGHLEIVKYLVEEVKTNTEVQNKYGDTPLHISSLWGRVEIVKYFIQHDVDTSIENNDGKTF